MNIAKNKVISNLSLAIFRPIFDIFSSFYIIEISQKLNFYDGILHSTYGKIIVYARETDVLLLHLCNSCKNQLLKTLSYDSTARNKRSF